MKSRLVKPTLARNPGDLIESLPEEILGNLKFTVNTFTNRPKPDDPRKHLIFPCFSEFGSEVVASMYCIPRIAQKWAGHYKTVIGWHGREYLYKHMVDEFWELNEDQMWLREYSRAFHHDSENLKKFEEKLKGSGVVVSASTMGRIAICTQCDDCWRYWNDIKRSEKCGFCGSKEIRRSLYSDIETAKKDAVLPPRPSSEKIEYASTLVGKNPVGVFARSRKCYGRNLPVDFYVSLIKELEDMGYEPIWLGEKSTTLPCPVDNILDFSRMYEASDIETTLAIVSLCRFTTQFWTASTRLSALVGIPYLLFESPDQLFGAGQEGSRLNLVTTGNRKIVVNHYLNVLNDLESGINLVKRCILEMEDGNYDDVIGMVDKPSVVKAQRRDFMQRQQSSFVLER